MAMAGCSYAGCLKSHRWRSLGHDFHKHIEPKLPDHVLLINSLKLIH